MANLNQVASRPVLRASLTKTWHGGWFPLVVAGAILIVMTTWRRGRQVLGQRLSDGMVDPGILLGEVHDVADLKAMAA